MQMRIIKRVQGGMRVLGTVRDVMRMSEKHLCVCCVLCALSVKFKLSCEHVVATERVCVWVG